MRLNGAIAASISQDQSILDELAAKEVELLKQLAVVQRDMLVVRTRNVAVSAIMPALDLSDPKSIRMEETNNG